ncbi:MAG: hypothetical protein R3Y60_00415 [bacterium]
MYNYLLETFLPWSLKTDYKNSIALLKKEKEQFMVDMYNHFASNFKMFPVFQLHMFRVSFSKINMLDSDLISVILPEHNKFHSFYILYNENGFNYFVLNKKDSHLELVDHNDKKICGVVSLDLSNLTILLTSYIASK